jgi:hypothetical protein
MPDSVLTTVSKDLNDFFSSTTTSAGAAGGTTVIDTALMAMPNQWITDKTYTRITSGTRDGDERKISSLDNTTGTLTTLAHGGQIANSVTYEVHRLFTASEKRIALHHAARTAFPYIHSIIKADHFRSSNWLINGDVEYWAAATAPDHWNRSAVTCTQTSTASLFTSGSYSCKLSTAAGHIEQSWIAGNNDDLKYLRGKSVTFRARGWSDTASSLRLAINDHATITYSDYHAGNSAWDDGDLYVTATISPTATEVAFMVYHDVAVATDYVDDLYVTGPTMAKVDVSDLGLALNRPMAVSYCPSTFRHEPWVPVRGYEVKSSENAVYITQSIPAGSPLRIEGIGYLKFLASGVESTAWSATIAIDDPQTKILSAAACLYLYQQMAMPNFTSGDNKAAIEAYAFWKQEYRDRCNQFRMSVPPIRVNWGL